MTASDELLDQEIGKMTISTVKRRKCDYELGQKLLKSQSDIPKTNISNIIQQNNLGDSFAFCEDE